MKENRSVDSIPREVALQLCAEISEKKKHKLFTQCWGCWKASKGDPAKMCFSSTSDYRGCRLVNARYAAGVENEAKGHSIEKGGKP